MTRLEKLKIFEIVLRGDLDLSDGLVKYLGEARLASAYDQKEYLEVYAEMSRSVHKARDNYRKALMSLHYLMTIVPKTTNSLED